jgi:hypothetical protein
LMAKRSRHDPRAVTVGGADADFQQIADAVAGAGEGGTIVLRPGTYHEHVQLRRGQRLLGPEPVGRPASETPASDSGASADANGGQAIIDGGRRGAVVRAADDCLLRNLTIRNGGAEAGVEDCGVMIEGCTGVVVQSCQIVENGHYGVILRRCDAVIEHNTIRANDILGIYVDEGVRVDVRFNLILDHRHSALDVEQPVEGSFTNNTVIRCGSTIYHGSTGTETALVIARNIFVGNEEAISAPAGTFGAIERNVFFENARNHWDWNADTEVELESTNVVADPRFVNPAAGDYRLAADSPAARSVPDGTNIGALSALPAQPLSVFISHSRADREYAERLAGLLVDAGIDVLGPDGDELPTAANGLGNALAPIDPSAAGAVVAVMTPEGASSENMLVELDRAMTAHVPIFPLLLRGEIFDRLRDIQCEDVTDGGMPARSFLDRIRSVVAPGEAQSGR